MNIVFAQMILNVPYIIIVGYHTRVPHSHASKDGRLIFWWAIYRVCTNF